MYTALGCNIVLHRGYGWHKLTPPTKVAPRPRYFQEHTFNYALIDPLTQDVFYIGKSDNPQQRFVQHLRDRSDSAKTWWISELRDRGREPALMILEEVEGAVALEREDWWLRHYEKPGSKLTNYVSQRRPFKERKERRRLALIELDWYKERPRIYRQLNQARMRGLAATLTIDDWADTLVYFKWKCAYCASSPVERLDYLVPLQQGGGVTVDNCIPACRACKTAKRTLSAEEKQAFHAYIEYGASIEIGPFPEGN